MRVTKIGAGIILAAAILLTGCSAPAAEEPKDDTSTSTTEETTAPSADCPKLEEGATVDGTALGTCITEAMTDTQGYAAKMTVLGMDTTAQYDPATEAVAWSTPMGSVVVIGDDAWVKSSTTDWQVADANSSDPIVAGLSQAAATANDADPAVAAAGLSGEFTVTGTGSRLGQDVYILTGTAEQEGVSVEMTYEITADYVVLATTGTTEAAGQTIDTSLEITEWDVKQDIVAPI
jgi:hypothetical protein